MLVVELCYDYIHLSLYKGHKGDLGQRVPHLRGKHPSSNKIDCIHLGKWALGFPLVPLP